MEIEHEAKVLDVDPNAVAAAILALGGVDHGEVRQRRFVYDTCPPVDGKWVRLREAGGRVTLAVKHIRYDGIDGTDEVEVEVGDFETAAAVLAAAGFEPNGYQENRRHSFSLDGVRLEIDSWPMIPPYLEIEADTPEAVRSAAQRLGYGAEVLTSENTTKVYARYGFDLKSMPFVQFQPSSLPATTVEGVVGWCDTCAESSACWRLAARSRESNSATVPTEGGRRAMLCTAYV